MKSKENVTCIREYHVIEPPPNHSISSYSCSQRRIAAENYRNTRSMIKFPLCLLDLDILKLNLFTKDIWAGSQPAESDASYEMQQTPISPLLGVVWKLRAVVHDPNGGFGLMKRTSESVPNLRISCKWALSTTCNKTPFRVFIGS